MNFSEVAENNPYFEKNKKFKLMLKSIIDAMKVSNESSFIETDLQTKEVNNIQVDQRTNCLFDCKVSLKNRTNTRNFLENSYFNDKQRRAEIIMPSSDNFNAFMECIRNKRKITYKCHVCDKIFCLKRQATKHVSVHIDEFKFTCSICNKSFCSDNDIYEHNIKNHSNDFSYKICNETLSKGENSLPSFSSVHVNEFPYVSHFNNLNFKNKNTETKISGTKLYSCKICHKSFKTKGYEKLHLITHTNKFNYSCADCHQSFRFPSSLTKHYRTIHESHDKLKKKVPQKLNKRSRHTNQIIQKQIFHNKGKIELKGINNGSKLKYASNSKSKNKIQIFKPNKLKNKKLNLKACKSYADVGKSLSLKGSKIQNFFQCQICFKKFYKSKLLKLHEKQNHNIKNQTPSNFDIFIECKKGEKFVCRVCSKNFIYKQSAMDHVSVHTNEHKHKCCLCTETFISRHSRQRHQLSHFYTIKYACHICKELFSDKGYRDVFHMTVHMKMFSYICHMCNKAFKNPLEYDQHTKLHPGKKSHQCIMCKKKFIHSDDLQIHLLVHKRNLPHYVCSICEENFTTKTNCYKHLRAKHNTKCLYQLM